MLRRAVGACASALQLSNQASCRGHGTALAGLCTAAQRFAHGDETIEQIRSRIFGNHIGNGLRSGRKVLRRKLVGDKVASYYPEPIERLDRMWEDPSEQERLDKLDSLYRRDKGPPKKGQGKRASKKK